MSDISFTRTARIYRGEEDLVGEHAELLLELDRCAKMAEKLQISELSFHLTLCKRMLLSHDTERITLSNFGNPEIKN